MKRLFKATITVEYKTDDSYYKGAKTVKEMTELDKLNFENDPGSVLSLVDSGDQVQIKVEDITPKVATLPKG